MDFGTTGKRTQKAVGVQAHRLQQAQTGKPAGGQERQGHYDSRTIQACQAGDWFRGNSVEATCGQVRNDTL